MDIQNILSLRNKLINDYGFYPYFGIELEFYIFYITKDEKFTSKKELLLLNDNQLSFLQTQLALEIKREKGKGQYELSIPAINDIELLEEQLEKYKRRLTEILIHEFNAIPTYESKPIIDDYGSSLQLNLSLHSNESQDYEEYNLYSIIDITAPPKNTLLGRTIAGTLSILNASIYALTNNNDASHLKRFISGFMTPLNISWGTNNRTTAIRIPSGRLQNKRLEFRIAGASLDIKIPIAVLLTGIFLGMITEIPLPEQVYGNADQDPIKSSLTPLNFTSSIKNYHLPFIISQILNKPITELYKNIHQFLTIQILTTTEIIKN